VSSEVDIGCEAVAAFPVTIDLPPPPESHLGESAAAIKQEYRISVRRKRLRCRNWEHLTEREDGSIFALEVGRSVEFDWTWEGAIAYRPGVSEDSFADNKTDDTPDDEMYWCGEVVEVDETGGRIFVSISNPDQTPTTGTFFVRPFEFLALLNEVYNSLTLSDCRY
jgi:hypothetical protein